MNEFSLTTPAVLFPAISLLMLAYTNRFLAVSNLIRSLKNKYVEDGEEKHIVQIRNLRSRVFLIRNMQMFGSISLFLCILSMFFIFENEVKIAKYIFSGGMLALILSVTLSLREIHLSVIALNVEMKDIEEQLKEKKTLLSKIQEFDF
ncbi:MAG: DUF2721 domain-containing protein [Saprospiraceae bacterium]|nr:DUF2721 domain-containing protein [Saprospiraceae bacterium]